MKEELLAEKPIYPRWRAYYAYILLFLLYMFDYIDRYVIVSLFPFLKNDWGLTDTELGLLVSAVFWSILVFTLPIGALIDRWSRKKSIGIMSIFWSLATLAGAFTANFRQLFTTRCAVGVGEAGYVPGGVAMISAHFPQEKRARMVGIWQAAIPLGSAIGVAVGGLIAQYFGWRHALGIVAIPGFLVAVLFFWVKDYKTVELVKSVPTENEVSKVRMSKRDIVRELFRSKSLVLDNLAFAACAFTTVALTSWLPSYFQRFEGLPIERAGLMSSVVMLLAVVGAPLGGFLTDQWFKKRINARLLLPAISSAISALLLFIGFFMLHGSDQFGILLVVGVTIIMFAPGAVAVTQDVVHPGLRSTSLSICIVVQHLLGSALGPLAIGALSDQYGLDKAMLCLPAFLLLAGILFFAGSFFYRRDVESVEKVEIVFEAR